MPRTSVALRFLAAALALAAVPAASLAQAVTPIRVGSIGYTDASSEPHYAQSAGIFKKHGLDATIVGLGGGGAIVAAVVGGSLDVGFSNVVSAAQALERGIPIVVLAPAAVYVAPHADTLLVKARGSNLKTGADLNGKTVAVTTLSGSLQVCASAWIDKNGGDAKSVHFVEIGFSEMTAALKQGRIDAAMISEPALTRDKADLEELGDAFAAVAPRWALGVFVTSKAWASAHPDAARAFVEAIVETGRWANVHHDETAKILATPSHIDLATFGAMGRSTYGDALTASMLQPVIDAAVKYGALKQTLDANQIVADSRPFWRGVK
jgi:NitT/TauT family transport system substrate-binding protein